MKIFLFIIALFMNAHLFACTPEAEVKLEISQFYKHGAICSVQFKLDLRKGHFWEPNPLCPLESDAIRHLHFRRVSCTYKKGQLVTGEVRLNDDNTYDFDGLKMNH